MPFRGCAGEAYGDAGKHVRSCIVYTWDHKSSASFWQGMKVQPIMADEVQTFKALITVHKVLQEGHPTVLKEAQANTGWLESLSRSVSGEGMKGYGKMISEYIYFLQAKLAFHRQHPEFNGGSYIQTGSRTVLTGVRNVRVRGVHQSQVHQRSQ